MGSNFSFAAVSDPHLEACFRPPSDRSEPGWLGADSSTSLRLNDTHHLWLWADTFWGTMSNATRQFDAAMPHNSVALTTSGPLPAPKFVARTEGASATYPASFFRPTYDSYAYYWMVAGAVLPKSGALIALTP